MLAELARIVGAQTARSARTAPRKVINDAKCDLVMREFGKSRRPRSQNLLRQSRILRASHFARW